MKPHSSGTVHRSSAFGEWPGNEWTNNGLDVMLTHHQACQNNAPAAPNRPEAYTVSAQSQGTWTDEQACVRKTVTGNGAYPSFYFGWAVTLDTTAAIAPTAAG